MSKNGNIIPEQQVDPKNNLKKTQLKQNYLLSIDNVDKLFKRAAIFTMLKAKARASLPEVPQVERILFNQCLSEYKQEQLTPVIYAKCLVKLIKAKNRLKDAYRMTEENKERAIPPQINQRRIQRFHHFYSIWRKRKGNKLIKLRKLNKRNKRSISTRTLFANKMDFELPKNIRNLRILERYGRTLKHCKRFISTMNERNANFLANLLPNVRLTPNSANTPSNLDGLQAQIEQFTKQLTTSISEGKSKEDTNLSFLSPRLFPLYPRKKKLKTPKNNNFINNLNSNISQLLSPDIFAFHNQTLSLSNLFPLEVIGQKEQIEWLDLLINITGMNKILDHLVNQLNPELSQLETKILPAIKQIETKEGEWGKLKASLNNKQIEMINKLGYTYLFDWQQKIIKINENNNWNTVENAENALEEKIEEIAKLGESENWKTLNYVNVPSFQQARKKRQVGGLAPDTEIGVHPIPRILTLEPFAFDTRLGGVVLEGLFLSPHAFYREIISPEILTIRLLSPVAFYATILSPMAVFARVLSPEVFKAQILTPQVLDTYTLSPEAFMAEVLSPVAAEARVASPRALFVQILGPSAGEVTFLSPNFFAVLVLSPHFLSPRIYSKEHYLIEILSPHILGGEHSSESEEDEHEHLGGAVRFVGWPDHSHGGKKKKGEGESEHKEEGGENQNNNKQGGEETHQHMEGEQHSEGTGQHSGPVS
uniref:Uncharacterized protein n=1 Tax=Meloidogyne enterolobii TaxID=390850 RepID=A0A6V7UPZ5_MELEN|nr:unnamed protein product [Meloidogyne enterolobii]